MDVTPVQSSSEERTGKLDALARHWRRAPRRWGHPLHSLCSYFAMFPPHMPRVFVEWLTKPASGLRSLLRSRNCSTGGVSPRAHRARIRRKPASVRPHRGEGRSADSDAGKSRLAA